MSREITSRANAYYGGFLTMEHLVICLGDSGGVVHANDSAGRHLAGQISFFWGAGDCSTNTTQIGVSAWPRAKAVLGTTTGQVFTPYTR